MRILSMFMSRGHGKRKSIAKKDFGKFLTILSRLGVRFVSPPAFIEGCKAGSSAGLSLMKHDVHSDLERAQTLAEIEAGSNVKATFFFLGEHDLSPFYDSARFWDTVQSIHSLGHEIGVHVDAHDMILRFGCVMLGIKRIQDAFLARAGIRIVAANLHGNTALRREYGSAKALFKSRSTDTMAIPHRFPLVGEKFSPYAGRYSLDTMAEMLGLDYWLDPTIYYKGEQISVPIFVSDNPGVLRASRESTKITEIQFSDIGRALQPELVVELISKPSQFLMHPQNIY
jgi:peptidoglycan/xylan/chitin deacetylase (PgdA/CDA1 family)